MKLLQSLMLILLLLVNVRDLRAEEIQVVLYRMTDRGANDIKWLVSQEKLSRSPRWDPMRKDCPISTAKAFKIATKWFKANGVGEAQILSIKLRRSTSTKEQDCWWYIIDAA